MSLSSYPGCQPYHIARGYRSRYEVGEYEEDEEEIGLVFPGCFLGVSLDSASAVKMTMSMDIVLSDMTLCDKEGAGVGSSRGTTMKNMTMGCSENLHLWYYLDTVWSETGYFGLLGNNHILFIILLYIIKG